MYIETGLFYIFILSVEDLDPAQDQSYGQGITISAGQETSINPLMWV